MVGHRWDAACSDLRRFLARNQISFEWLVPDLPESPHFGRARIHQTAIVRSCGLLTAMSSVDRRRAISPKVSDFRRIPALPNTTLFVIGGGPAGLAAAVYGASEGLRTIVVEREAPGGQAGTSSRIENYLGFPSGVSGDELASRALQQARRLGAEILVTRSITRIDPARATEVSPRW